MAEREVFLTVREVAEQLRTSNETIRRWLRSGKLKGARLGGQRFGWRVSTTELDALLRKAEEPREKAS